MLSFRDVDDIEQTLRIDKNSCQSIGSNTILYRGSVGITNLQSVKASLVHKPQNNRIKDFIDGQEG